LRAHAARNAGGQQFRELADPVGRGRSIAAEAAEQVGDQTARIAFGLFGVPPTPS
jgi:hypothetical protein